jgi:uncharacterized membrane protein
MSDTAAALGGPAAATSRVAEWTLARRWSLAVWGAMVAWTAAVFAIARSDYVNFRVGRFDLGNMVQAVWSTAHGRPLDVTNVWGEQVSRLGIHVDPVLALFAPLWLVAPTPLTILFVNVVALALGALPVFWLARRHLASEKAAALLALVYLVYPWFDSLGADPAGFHPVVLAVPLFLYALWFLDTGRIWAFCACAVLVLTTGELMGVTLAALGLWYAFARKRHRMGLVVAGLALLWSVVAIRVVVPHFSGGPSVYYGYYASVGGSPGGILRTAFTHPGTIAAALLTSRNALYLLLLGAPLAGIFLLAPGLVAVVVPQLIASGLSDNREMTQPQYHYVAPVVPFLIAGTVLGLRRLSPSRRTLAAGFVLALSVIWSALAGPWPGAPGNGPAWDAVKFSPQHLEAVRAAVRMIPDGAAASTTNKAGSHLSGRRYLYSVTVVKPRTEWILLDTTDPFVSSAAFPVLRKSPETLVAFRKRLDRDPRWRRVFDRDGVLVFRRISPT